MLMPSSRLRGRGGLIVAIGAQNAFVLTQSVRRNHAWAVALLCSLCDALLIGAGVAGMGAAVAASPLLGRVAAWAGAAFLFGTAWGPCARPCGGRLDVGAQGRPALGATLAATLAVTLLNPHVYLDTVVMLGSLSGQFPGPGRYVFGAGGRARPCRGSWAWAWAGGCWPRSSRARRPGERWTPWSVPPCGASAPGCCAGLWGRPGGLAGLGGQGSALHPPGGDAPGPRTPGPDRPRRRTPRPVRPGEFQYPGAGCRPPLLSAPAGLRGYFPLVFKCVARGRPAAPRG
jgi:L-lysine exporter family protein LysE/ArgO